MVIRLKKNILFLIVLLSIILCGYLFFQITYKSEFEKFTYDSGKRQITKYLENNRRELENIANELYKSKSSKKRPYKNIVIPLEPAITSTFPKLPLLVRAIRSGTSFSISVLL